jgi:glycosyltransferase involved in cell wall biosynthesis
MKKILLVSNVRYTITNFRGELVRDLRALGHQVKIVCPIGKDLDGSFVTAQDVIPLSLDRKGIHPLRDMKTLFDLIRIVQREKPDIVLNFTIKPVIYGSIAAGFFSKAKIFSNITGLGYVFTDASTKASLLKSLVQVLYKLALSLNSRVFFQNPDDMELFRVGKMIPYGKAKLIHGSGINLEKFADTCAVKAPMSFIFVGRLLRDKGIRELIEALRIVRKKFPHALCEIIGEIDPLNPNSFTESDIEAWGDEGAAQILGRIEDVRPHLAKAQVMVLPSYREGTPRSVLEAMAMGLPIVTTDAPGCRETVVDGVNGFLVPIKDSSKLAEKMIYFLENPSQILKMGEASRSIAEEKYDVKKVNAEILKTMELV